MRAHLNGTLRTGAPCPVRHGRRRLWTFTAISRRFLPKPGDGEVWCPGRASGRSQGVGGPDQTGRGLLDQRGRGEAEQFAGVGQYGAHLRDELVQYPGVGDQRRGDLEDRVAAVIGAGDQSGLAHRLRHEAS